MVAYHHYVFPNFIIDRSIEGHSIDDRSIARLVTYIHPWLTNQYGKFFFNARAWRCDNFPGDLTRITRVNRSPLCERTLRFLNWRNLMVYTTFSVSYWYNLFDEFVHMSYYFEFSSYCMNNCLSPSGYSFPLYHVRQRHCRILWKHWSCQCILLQVSSKSYLTLLLGIQMNTHTIAYYR